MENYMAEVAKMLGVELGEEFEIDFGNGINTATVYLNSTGLNVKDTNMVYVPNASSAFFEWILTGLCFIKRKPWRPQKGETFYTVTPIGIIEPCIYTNGPGYCSLYKIGNCYKTKEAAEFNRDKWVTFYASNEVLEV